MDTNGKKQQEIIDALRSENARLKREVKDLKSENEWLQQDNYPYNAEVKFEDYLRIVRDRQWRCEDCGCGIDVEEGQVPHVFCVTQCHDCYQPRVNEYNFHCTSEDAYRYYSKVV